MVLLVVALEVGGAVMVKWDQEREGMGTVAKVAERITPNVEPPPYVGSRLLVWV